VGGQLAPFVTSITKQIVDGIETTFAAVSKLVSAVWNSKGPFVDTNPLTPTPFLSEATGTPIPTTTGVTPTITLTPRPPSPTATVTVPLTVSATPWWTP